MTGLIAGLLPAAVACEELFEPPPDPGLFPQEWAVVAGAVEKRRSEFAAARGCARRALIRLGHPPQPILPGEGGAPVWPSGIVGSLTHSGEYAAAAVAPAVMVRSVGIDAEPGGPLPDGVLPMVAGPDERAMIAALEHDRPDVSWGRILFSAKESVYKAWFPITGRWLDYEEAEVGIDPDGGAFTARLLVPGPAVDGRRLTGFTGRWATARGLVLTAVVVPTTSGIPLG